MVSTWLSLTGVGCIPHARLEADRTRFSCQGREQNYTLFWRPPIVLIGVESWNTDGSRTSLCPEISTPGIAMQRKCSVLFIPRHHNITHSLPPLCYGMKQWKRITSQNAIKLWRDDFALRFTAAAGLGSFHIWCTQHFFTPPPSVSQS